MADQDYEGTPYDPQDLPVLDQQDFDAQPDPRFTGNGMDPTFQPQVKGKPPFDLIYAVDGVATILGSDGKAAPAPQMQGGQPQEAQDNDEPQYQPMDEDSLKALIKLKVETSHQWYGSGKLSSKRIDADRYYRGAPLGNEQDGRSQVVSRDVAETVDNAMPSLMRIFAGGEQVCVFEPVSQEDEEDAKQATDYINHVFMDENEGFMILITWFKDSLLKKNGIIKIWHDIRMKRTKDNYQGLTQGQLQALQMDPSLKVSQIQSYQDTVISQDPMGNMAPPQPTTFYNCVVVSTKPEKRIKIMNVPPDEFIIERRATSIYTAGFLAHRGKRTISDLLECGYDPEKVAGIPRGEDHDDSSERIERFADEDQLPYGSDDEIDQSTRKVWVTEAYVKCDYDGDGIAEWRKVTLAGDAGAEGSIVLDNVETDDHAFADLTPTPEPHKFYGMSFFDQTKDIQEIKTALIRGILDSTYLANAPRMGAVDGQVNMDDLLDARPGGVVRLKNPNALVPIPATMVSGEVMNMVSYIDSVKEKRTGVSAASAGLNPNILNSSATGADILNNNNQQRLELIARIFAETGVKRAFRRIFQLVCQYQDVPKTVRLRNKWVTVDPTSWKDRMDVSASVGIGMGSKQQQAQIALQMLNMDEQIVRLQGGIDGPLLNGANIYAKLAKLVEAVGWKTPDPYYMNPAEQQPKPQKPPTPEQQLDMAKLQNETQQMQMDNARRQTELEANIQLKSLDLEMKKIEFAMKQLEFAALATAAPGTPLADKEHDDVAMQNTSAIPGFMQNG